MNLRLSLLLCLGATACATAPAPSTPTATSAASESGPAPTPGNPLALPTHFVEDRFYVVPVTSDGQKLELFTDTGGGLFITEGAAERLKLATEEVSTPESPTGKAAMARLPAFRPGEGIPSVELGDGRVPVAPAAMTRQLQAMGLVSDGMLGQAWFAMRVWTFDYPGGKLWWRARGDVPAVDERHRVPLGFRKSAMGARETHFPRIQLQVDGETLDLLFDTGATVSLTDKALQALGDGRPVARATSFITRSTFERWRQRHPDWRVIENADKVLPDSALIEVPAVELAGHTVGPVWFTTRPDKNFHQFMSQFMDQRVEGALGGSALRFFRVTVDYPNEVALFERAP
ncbi:MAG: hypothetical protein JXB05_15245 [Myxococcaceae bacterium]|nr:hypothetical protein [Myxococcaceae bacterium]